MQKKAQANKDSKYFKCSYVIDISVTNKKKKSPEVHFLTFKNKSVKGDLIRIQSTREKYCRITRLFINKKVLNCFFHSGFKEVESLLFCTSFKK